MSKLPPEQLNAMLKAFEVQTGVYADHQRHMVIVVKVTKEGKVFFLHFKDCLVQLEVSFKEKFLVDYPVQFYKYPALRAVRRFAQYVRDGFKCTPEARKVINSIIVR
jgi:hypothetical protein